MQQLATPEIAPSGSASTEARTFCLIIFPQGVEDAVVDILDDIGVPGFTQSDKVIGRGERGRHFDNPIWPGADGAIFTVTTPAQAGQVSAAVIDLSQQLDERSHGLYGIHVFTWDCQQLS